MNIQQDKKFHSHLSIHNFFETYGAQFATVVPAISAIITNYNTLFAQMDNLIMEVDEKSNPYTLGKEQLKEECIAGIWKLTAATQFHYTIINNEIAANNVKMTRAMLEKLTEAAFYNFGQMILNLYEPGPFVAYGITLAEVNALKLKMTDFPNRMQVPEEAKLKRKLAAQQLIVKQKEISIMLNTLIDPLMNVLKPGFEREYLVYKNHRRIGLIKPNKGKPHKMGTLPPGQIVVLDEHTYRRKRLLLVINKGNSELRAGIGLSPDKMHGTPFIIGPGAKAQRNSKKMASEGTYFLLKNTGATDTDYQVWMKE